MPKVTRGSITVDFTIKDMFAYIENDLDIDANYVRDKINEVFGIDIPISNSHEFDCTLSDSADGKVIRFFIPAED